eukprot:12607714-Ditylum_brightwellii.AAC.1
MRAWREAAAILPSSQHLGHFKVLVWCHSLPLDTDEGQELQVKQNNLVDAHTGLLQYVLDKCYSYKRWQNIVNIVMRDLLLSSEQCGTINKGLHEGRHGHDAQMLSLIEELKYDKCYYSMKSLINF